MPSGGHARSGPAPDPNALRRERDKGEWTHLPAEGRVGDLPPWPLDRPAQRELHLWEEHWRRPQALMWERLNQHLEVATYIRTLVRYEQQDSSVALGSLIRGQLTDLGLNVPGLRANRWIIDQAATPKTQGADGSRRTSASRARFASIEGGRAAS